MLVDDSSEKKLLTLILLNPVAIEHLVIKPEYFLSIKNQLLFKDILNFYKKKQTIDISQLNNNVYAVELITQELIVGDWEKNIILYQNDILKNYKKINSEQLLSLLKENKISEEHFIEKIKENQSLEIIKFIDPIISVGDIGDNGGKRTIVKSGTIVLDNKIEGFALGEMSVWSGENGSAKSTYLNQVALNAINQDYKVLIYSGELTPERLFKWISYQYCTEDKLYYSKEYNKYYVPDILKDKIKGDLNNKLFIYNNILGSKVEILINTIRDFSKKNDIKVIIIDNLMSIDITELSKESQLMAQGELAKRLSMLAKELNVHIHFVCHPRKTTMFLRKTDISGSSDLTNNADNVFILHRVNHDFIRKTKEMFGWDDKNPIYKYTNILEVCKCRENGTQDYFVGMNYKVSNRRLIGEYEKEKRYKWD